MSKKEFSVLLGLLFTILFSICAQDIKTAQEIQNNTLRLHIIANSNSETDQQLKLEVRDEILAMEQLFTQAQDFDTAVKTTAENLGDMEKKLNEFLSVKGTDYRAKCSIEDFYFDTKQYSGFALPQGQYTALTVRLGRAEGENWWCVVYPALCSQSCGEMTPDSCDDFIKTEKITPRFKVVEIYENIKNRFYPTKAERYRN